MIYSSRVTADWRQLPKVSPDTSPSPPTTRPTTPTSPPLAWRRLSSSSSKTSSSSSSFSSDWRGGSPPRPIGQTGLPSFNRLEDGDILYLPSTSIPSSSIIRQHPNQSRFEDHPLVVLGTRREAGEEIVKFRQFTTFGGLSVEEKKPEHQQGFFMLCENRKNMETKLTNPIARMALGQPLKRRSYINLSHNSLFEIEYKYLDSFHDSGLRRLDAETVAFIKSAPSST